MPIDFPNNPSSGQTYSYAGQQWSYDGVAWNKIITATIPLGGICGSIQYNDGASGLSGNSNFYYDGTNVVLIDPTHLDGDILGGVHHYAHNNSGVGITRGWPVYITGMDGASTIIRIATADASDSSKMPAIGLAESDIADGAFGHITMFGTLLQTDTSGYVTNQTLYVAPGGGLTSGRPSASNQLIQNIGKVGRVHPNTGSLIVMGPGRSNDVPNIVPIRSWLEMPSGQTATSIVTLFNGLSGSVTGVQSIDGVTGAITNVARTNVGNTFTVSQKISGAFTSLRIENTVLGTTADYSSSAINFYSGTTSTGQTILPVATTPISTITLPNFTTTLAGLTGTQTFTGTNTFSALTNFPGGISAAGATFSSLVRFNSGISAAGGSTFASVATNYLRSSDLTPAYPLFINDLGGSQSFIGDYSGNNLNTYLLVNDDNGDITLNAPFSGVFIIGAPTSTLSIDSQANFTNLPISGATFSSLARFNAGISAAGGTFGSSGVHVFGNITTSPSGAIESGYNGHFRGLQWIDPNGGRSRIVHNYGSFPHSIDFRVHGASFDASGEISRMQIFASGVSFSQGATFRNSINITGNVIASGGISAAGATFDFPVRINSAVLGVTSSNYVFGINAGNALTTATNNILIGSSAGLGITNQSEIVAIGNNALANSTKSDGVAIGTRALQNNTGQYAVGIGYEALLNNTSANVLGIGYGTLRSNAAGNNIGIGPYALYQNTNAAASSNCAIGVNAMYANSGGFRNVAIGNDTLIGGAAYTGQSGVENVVIGFQAGYNNKSGSDNVFIGFNAGFGNSTGNSNIYIGSGVCGSTSGTVTREIVIGADALGLGSNTAVIGATSQTSATIYGLLAAPSGISAAGGTFSGTISLNGQTFTNVVHGLNGYTGNIGAPQWPVGQTSGALTVLTYPSGVTSFSTKIPFYLPYQNVSAAGSITGTVSTNRVYFTLFNTPRTINIHTLRFSAFNTGITGSCHFGIYSADSNSGLPKSLLYSSASTIVGSGFATTSVTNASGLLTISPGYFYIAVVFNNTPTLYGLNNAQLPIFGSNQYTAGYLNSSPFADMSGFTLPTSLPASGVTFGLIDYIPGAPALRGVFTEYRIV